MGTSPYDDAEARHQGNRPARKSFFSRTGLSLVTAAALVAGGTATIGVGLAATAGSAAAVSTSPSVTVSYTCSGGTFSHNTLAGAVTLSSVTAISNVSLNVDTQDERTTATLTGTSPASSFDYTSMTTKFPLSGDAFTANWELTVNGVETDGTASVAAASTLDCTTPPETCTSTKSDTDGSSAAWYSDLAWNGKGDAQVALDAVQQGGSIKLTDDVSVPDNCTTTSFAALYLVPQTTGNQILLDSDMSTNGAKPSLRVTLPPVPNDLIACDTKYTLQYDSGVGPVLPIIGTDQGKTYAYGPRKFKNGYGTRTFTAPPCTSPSESPCPNVGTLKCGTNDFNMPDAVVRGKKDSSHLIAQISVPADLQGKTVNVTLQATNNGSVHPDSTVIVSSGSTSVTLSDVEATKDKVTSVSGTLTLGKTVDVTVKLGKDGVFSGGGDLKIVVDCTKPTPPPTTAPPTTQPPVTPSPTPTTTPTSSPSPTPSPTSTTVTPPAPTASPSHYVPGPGNTGDGGTGTSGPNWKVIGGGLAVIVGLVRMGLAFVRRQRRYGVPA